MRDQTPVPAQLRSRGGPDLYHAMRAIAYPSRWPRRLRAAPTRAHKRMAISSDPSIPRLNANTDTCRYISAEIESRDRLLETGGGHAEAVRAHPTGPGQPEGSSPDASPATATKPRL